MVFVGPVRAETLDCVEFTRPKTPQPLSATSGRVLARTRSLGLWPEEAIGCPARDHPTVPSAPPAGRNSRWPCRGNRRCRSGPGTVCETWRQPELKMVLRPEFYTDPAAECRASSANVDCDVENAARYDPDQLSLGPRRQLIVQAPEYPGPNANGCPGPSRQTPHGLIELLTVIALQKEPAFVLRRTCGSSTRTSGSSVGRIFISRPCRAVPTSGTCRTHW